MFPPSPTFETASTQEESSDLIGDPIIGSQSAHSADGTRSALGEAVQMTRYGLLLVSHPTQWAQVAQALPSSASRAFDL